MKNSILFLLCSLFLLVNSTIGQEHVMVSGKDSLVITKEEVPEEVLKKMQAYDFGSEIKKFNESAYGVFNFNDDDRRVFKNADQIQVVFNEDTLIISEIRSEERRVGKECRSRWSR